MIIRNRRASLLVILAMSTAGSLLVAGGSIAAPAEPGCTVQARVDRAAAGTRRVDLSVTCDYQVRSIEVRAKNRRFSWVGKAPTIAAGDALESASCHRRFRSGLICRGTLGAGTEIAIHSQIDRSACLRPQARFVVSVSGGPECSGVCPDIGYRSEAVTAAGRSLGCS